MKGIFVLSILSLVAFSCDDSASNLNSDEEFTVAVINANDFTTCGLPIINFSGNLDKIRKVTECESTTFNAFMLKEEFRIEGLELKVKVRKTRDDELRPCLTMGINWPWVTVMDARIAD